MRLLLVLLLAVSSFGHAAEPELLEPEKAFRFSARLQDPRTIEVTYRIAPGYYLYRDKFRFSAVPAEVKLGAIDAIRVVVEARLRAATGGGRDVTAGWTVDIPLRHAR